MKKVRFGGAEHNDDSRDINAGGAPDGTHDDHDDGQAAVPRTTAAGRRVNGSRMLVYGVLPGLALALAMAAGLLKWHDSSAQNVNLARVESVKAAKDSTIALLRYRPGTVEQDVQAARNRLTGRFRETYIQVSQDVLIPGAKEQQVTATASVPAAASVSATENHAVVLVFVDQTVTVGTSPPAATASSVRVTLDRIGGRWLVSGFDPV